MKHQQLCEVWQRESKHKGSVRPLADPTTPASDRCRDALRHGKNCRADPTGRLYLPSEVY